MSMNQITDQELAAHWCAKDQGSWKSPCCSLTIMGSMTVLQAVGEELPAVEESCPGFVQAMRLHVQQAVSVAARRPAAPHAESEEVESTVQLVCSSGPCPAGYEHLRRLWDEVSSGACTECERDSTRLRIRREIRKTMK